LEAVFEIVRGTPMKILVMGAGALGSVFGGLLAEAGHNVTLVGRRPHMETIARGGLTIEGIWGQHRVGKIAAVPAVASSMGRDFDAVLVTTKSYDTQAAVSQVKEVLRKDTLVASLQNGLGNLEIIAEAVGPQRTVGGRVIFGAEVVHPGTVKVTVYADKVLLGSPAKDADKVAIRRLAKAIDAAHIPCDVTDAIEGYIWGKVVYNCCLNGLSAVLELPYGKLAEEQHTRSIMNQVMEEGLAIAQKKGVNLPWGSVQEYRAAFYGTMVPPTASHESSMLQDIRRGKRTEIDALNGALVRLGVEAGLPATANWTITELVKAKETLARLAAKK
jgi:2-dehydropantoate 2-reductase